MEDFGFPPNFPEVVEVQETKEDDVIPKDKSKGKLCLLILNSSFLYALIKYAGKKSKAVAKSGGAKYQWQIMQSLGLEDDEIRLFADPSHWLKYFPPLAKKDLMKLGLHVHLKDILSWQ